MGQEKSGFGAVICKTLLEYRSVITALVVKLGSAATSFLLIFVVARYSGATVTGDYAIAVATAGVAALIATFGLDFVVIRAIGGDLRELRPDAAWNAIQTVTGFVLSASFVMAALMFVLSAYAPLAGATIVTMRMAAISVLVSPIQRIAVVSLRAYGAIVLSQVFDGLLQTSLILPVILVLIVKNLPLESWTLALLYSLSAIATAAISWMTLSRQTRRHRSGFVPRPGLIMTGVPVLAAALVQALSSWSIMALVGRFDGTGSVGAFRVAAQIGMTVALVITTMDTLASPQFAGDFRQGDNKAAWRRHYNATIFMIAAGALPAGLCLIFPRHVLALFGPEFTTASSALMILGFAQVVNILTGPIGSVMIMSGHERLSLQLSIGALILALVTGITLIPTYGIFGAALANAAALCFRNVLAFILMRRLLPIRDPSG